MLIPNQKAIDYIFLTCEFVKSGFVDPFVNKGCINPINKVILVK